MGAESRFTDWDDVAVLDITMIMATMTTKITMIIPMVTLIIHHQQYHQTNIMILNEARGFMFSDECHY